jgi:hypothetical protein
MSVTINGTDNSASLPALVGSDTDTGVFFPAANTMAFSTGGTERVRVDSAGNLGVGTSSPNTAGVNKAVTISGTANAILELNGGATRAGYLFASTATNATILSAVPASSILQFNTVDTERMRIDSAGKVGININYGLSQLTIGNANSGGNGAYATYPGTFTINEASLTSLQQTGGIEFKGSVFGVGYGSKILGADNGTLLFGNRSNSATWSERMRILDTGEVCIGRTSGLAAGTLLAITSASGSGSISCGDDADGTSYGIVQIVRGQDQPDNKFHLSFVRAGAKIAGMGFLDNSSTLAIQNASNNAGNGVTLTDGATSWGTTSDERKKDILGNVENALPKIANWRTIYYAYKNDEKQEKRVGLIAQDVQKTLPEAISIEEDEDKTLQLRYSETIPVLVKAIQELNAKVDAQTKRITDLEEQVINLGVK